MTRHHASNTESLSGLAGHPTTTVPSGPSAVEWSELIEAAGIAISRFSDWPAGVPVIWLSGDQAIQHVGRVIATIIARDEAGQRLLIETGLTTLELVPVACVLAVPVAPD